MKTKDETIDYWELLFWMLLLFLLISSFVKGLLAMHPPPPHPPPPPPPHTHTKKNTCYQIRLDQRDSCSISNSWNKTYSISNIHYLTLRNVPFLIVQLITYTIVMYLIINRLFQVIFFSFWWRMNGKNLLKCKSQLISSFLLFKTICKNENSCL